MFESIQALKVLVRYFFRVYENWKQQKMERACFVKSSNFFRANKEQVLKYK